MAEVGSLEPENQPNWFSGYFDRFRSFSDSLKGYLHLGRSVPPAGNDLPSDLSSHQPIDMSGIERRPPSVENSWVPLDSSDPAKNLVVEGTTREGYWQVKRRYNIVVEDGYIIGMLGQADFHGRKDKTEFCPERVRLLGEGNVDESLEQITFENVLSLAYQLETAQHLNGRQLALLYNKNGQLEEMYFTREGRLRSEERFVLDKDQMQQVFKNGRLEVQGVNGEYVFDLEGENVLVRRTENGVLKDEWLLAGYRMSDEVASNIFNPRILEDPITSSSDDDRSWLHHPNLAKEGGILDWQQHELEEPQPPLP